MNMNHSVQYIVEKVYASGCLGKTKRQQDLLAYLLEENRSGRLEKIKEYNIAVDVMGRSKDFSPAADSIVRAEMRRLRKNLSLYNSGSQDLQLEIPRARYEVVITNKVKAKPYSPIKSYFKPIVIASSAVALIASLTLDNYPQEQDSTIASNCSTTIPNVGMVNSGSPSDLQLYVGKIIQSSLSQYSNIQFVDNIQACTKSGTPSFTLDYMAFEDNGTYRISLTTYSEQHSNIIHFEDIRGVGTTPENDTDLYYAVVKSIVSVAKPYGTISQHSLSQDWGDQRSYSDYNCMMKMHDAITTDALEDYNIAYACLKVAADSGAASLDIKAGLAGSYLEQVLLYRPKTVDNPLHEIKVILDDSGDEWINSVEMTLIKIAYEVERPDFNLERFETILNLASNHYQENPHVLLLVATYSGFKIGDWERAKRLVEKVKRIHVELDNSIFLVDAVYSFLHDAPADVMQTCALTYSEHSLFSNIIINACARYAQDSVWTRKTEANLKKLRFDTPAQRSVFIKNKGFDPHFTTEIVAALNLPPA